MEKITKFLFALADTLAYLQMLVTVVLIVQLLGRGLTLTFATSAADAPQELVLTTWVWFIASLVGGAIAVLGCYLHLKRQVLGVFLIVFVLLLGLLIPSGSFAFAVALVSIQIIIYALPWSLMYLDLKKRGVVVPPS